MYISARADYALRALLEIAAGNGGPVTMADVVARQRLPRSYAGAILPELRRAGFVRLHRDAVTGYLLQRPAAEITVGAVVRSLDGPLMRVRGQTVDDVHYDGAAKGLSSLWARAQADLDQLLDGVTLADLIDGNLPEYGLDAPGEAPTGG
jgi:Rrf2 family protein